MVRGLARRNTFGARRIVATVLGLLCVSDVGRAEACDGARLPVCATLWDADLVFVGTAARVSGDKGSTQAEFTVDEWLRGERVGEQVTLVSEGIGFSCDYDFKAGVQYLVFTSRDTKGRWKATSCGGTVPLLPASPVLQEIRGVLRSRATGAVSGQVTFDAFPDERLGGGPPIADATVILESGRQQLTTTTNAIGVYRFDRSHPASTRSSCVCRRMRNPFRRSVCWSAHKRV